MTNETALSHIAANCKSVHLLREFLPDYSTYPLLETVITVDALDTLVYKGIRLWSAIKPSVAAYLQWDSISEHLKALDASEWDCLKRFLRSMLAYIDGCEALLNRLQPTHCLIFNGSFYRERAMLEVCRQNGVSVLAIESSTFADFKHVSQTGVVGNHNDWALLGDDWTHTRVLNSVEKENLDAFMRSKFAGADNFVQQPVRREGVRDRLRLGSFRRIVAFFGQVPHDSVIVRAERAFGDVPFAIRNLLQIFATSYFDVALILRLHPGGEVTSMRKDHLAGQLTRVSLPDNIRLVTGLQENTHDIMELADVGITHSSQAGLEFLWLHKPLIVLGDAYYSNKGFTWDVRSAEELRAALPVVLQQSTLTARQSQTVDSFLFGLLFEYLIPFCRTSGHFTEEGCRMISNILCGRSRRCPSQIRSSRKPNDGVK